GEVGLTGEIRGIQNGEKILAEAGRLGYEQIIMPKKSVDKLDRSVLKGSCRVVAVSNIYEAIDAFRGESLGI
ncbi:MAG: DNA repair protein RadA, partial [Eubacteriaceae bacterium]|nr:DNA repair protein RadA [Eubacteriaceae bacterium]